MKARKVYYLALFIFVSLSACGLKPSKHGKLIGSIHAYQEQKGGLAEQNKDENSPENNADGKQGEAKYEASSGLEAPG